MASRQSINSLFKNTLGRSADKGGLDYYTKMANEKGVDWVKNSLSGSDEAKSYKSSGGAATVSQNDRASGISYRNSSSSPTRSSSSSSTPTRSSSSSSSSVSDSAINDLYQQYLGRSADQGGLDYWRQESGSKGLDYMRNQLAGSDEAKIYQQRGTGLAVSSLDQVGGLDYRNADDIAVNQARDTNDYGLLQSAMQKGVDVGRFETVPGDNGQTLYRSDNGGLYSVTGQPVQQSSAPQSSAPQSTVSPNQTSQYQLDQMLASDSPLMQRAATQGQQMASQRGLLNSSIAGEAAQGAMIDRATPFAQQDAKTYFQNSQANTDRQQQAFISNQQYQQQRGLNDQQFGQSLQQMASQYGYDSELSTQQANQSLSNLYATSTANAWGVYSNNVTDLIGQASGSINQIQMNPDITAGNKEAMIQQILAQRDTDLNFQQGLYGQLSSYLQDTGVFPNLAAA